jgi:nucleotide-binding universal stress UspA family protein
MVLDRFDTPSAMESTMFKLIVLALDGSKQSLTALTYAIGLAESCGAELIIVHAYAHTSDLRDKEEYKKRVAQRKRAGQKILDDARGKFTNARIVIEENLLEGPAAEAILTVAQTRGADLIIIGTRGMGSLEGLLLGSVSTKVTHEAPCTVMVVR